MREFYLTHAVADFGWTNAAFVELYAGLTPRAAAQCCAWAAVGVAAAVGLAALLVNTVKHPCLLCRLACWTRPGGL